MNFILKELSLKSDFTFNLNALSNKANTLQFGIFLNCGIF